MRCVWVKVMRFLPYHSVARRNGPQLQLSGFLIPAWCSTRSQFSDCEVLSTQISHPQVRSTIDNAHCQIPSLGHESSLALCLILQPILFPQKPTGATLLRFWTISNYLRTYLLHSGQKVIVASLSMWSPTDVFIIKHFEHMRGPSPGISTPQIQHFLSITVYLQYWYTVQARLPRSELIISKPISSSE